MPCVLCSTYYSFCGNAGLKQKDGSPGEFRAAMCTKWLHPVAIRDHPAFASWVLYGMRPHARNILPDWCLAVMHPVQSTDNQLLLQLTPIALVNDPVKTSPHLE